MAQTCVSRNINIVGGDLGIEPWAVPRHVLDQTLNSVGDGSFDQETSLPGKLMIDSGILTWTNTSPLPATVLLRINRAHRDYVVSNPNLVQIRDRFTTAIGGATPRTPDPSALYQGATGGGVDIGATTVGQPRAGIFYAWEDAHITEDFIGPIPPGEDFKARYRCYLWTPPPWSNNANANAPVHEARVRNTRIQLIAFPSQDTAVISG